MPRPLRLFAQSAHVLIPFLDEIYMSDKASVQYALRLFVERKLDFVDCLLAGYHHMRGREVMTFDKKLKVVLDLDPLSSEMN